MIFIFSLSRSGSSWLGKIFDSHPDVFYLHEPDIEDRGLDLLPYWFEETPKPTEVEGARRYLKRLENARSLRATGTRPFFSKHYRGSTSEHLRRVLIYGAKASERMGLVRPANHIHIPDFHDRASPQIMVIKSVTAHGRADAFLRAADSEFKPVLLLRDPRAYVSSMVRGSKTGMMESPPGLGRLLKTRAARRIGLTPSSLELKDDIELHAWTWLLANMEAEAAIRAAGGTIIKYELLGADALTEAKVLFKKMSLEWAPETAKFLQWSAESEGEYYSVFRDPTKTMHRWRDELSYNAISRIENIVKHDPIGQSYISG